MFLIPVSGFASLFVLDPLFWTTDPLFSCRVNNTVALPTAHILLFLLPQDPKPSSVDPAKGPAAGGTVITITGEDLDTATKDDVTVAVGGVPCEVYVFTAVPFLTSPTPSLDANAAPSPLQPVIRRQYHL